MNEKIWEKKTLLDDRESRLFSPFAAMSSDAVRRHQDKSGPDDSYRQAYSKDADRILHSLAYTRYIDKTQVFSLIQNDHLTHRIIHVQLLSRIARTIGRYLGLNEDLIESASLGHDIGHPPFGHDGEKILSELTRKNGAGFFHHNLQSIQFLDRIERNGQGWNLSLQTLDAIVCHNGEIHDEKMTPQTGRTFDDFDGMTGDMKKQSALTPLPMTMEGCVVRMADTVSYVGRDMEDALRLGLIRRDDIPEKAGRVLGRTNGTIVFSLVTDIISNSMEDNVVSFSKEVSESLLELKTFNYEKIYANPKIKTHLKGIEAIFHHLFYCFLEDLESSNHASPVFTEFLEGMSDRYKENHSNVEIVRDFISGMTDSYLVSKAPSYMRPRSVTHV